MSPSGAIDEVMIEQLVHGFYADVRHDELLGPIFSAQVKDWDAHLRQLCAFWSSVLLKTGRYQGQPMLRHLPLPVDATHFDRWLDLFAAATQRYCDADSAAQFVRVARRIAQSLEFGVAASRRIVLQEGARLAPRVQAQTD